MHRPIPNSPEHASQEAVLPIGERSQEAAAPDGPLPGAGPVTAGGQCESTSNWRRKAVRWWYVLRYYRTSQLVARLVSVARRRTFPFRGNRRYLRPPEIAPKPRENPALSLLLDHKLAGRRANDSAVKASEILEGTFRFLNEERVLPDPVDWRLRGRPAASHLWRFYLHYHEFLLDLAAEGIRSSDPIWFERAWDLVTQWIARNPPGDVRLLRDSWHAYCISRRLPAWILLWSASPPPEDVRELVLGSMFSQVGFLENHLEWDVRGNHLLENAKALVLAGACLEGPEADRWLKKGASILRRELAEQILPHGEHFERAPMYHAQVLEALLDVRDAVRAVLPDLSGLCEATALEMASFLKTILHPDGQIPLLGDSCLAETAPPGHLIARGAQAVQEDSPSDGHQTVLAGHPPAAEAVGSYWVYRHDQDFLLLDAGPVGPDHLPGHAHADLLTFEASIRGHRVFVDSGVFNYQAGDIRQYCRGTAAHNVLEIDDQDQCDMWSSFRMGYRGWPDRLETGDDHGFQWARASHNAYRRLRVPRVGRWIASRPGGPWLCIDWAEGTGKHKLSNRLHFHPDIHVEQVAADQLLVQTASVPMDLRFLAPGRVTVTTGWYCPEFGVRKQGPVVEWTATARLPVATGWCLTWGERRGTASLDRTCDRKLLLRWSDGEEPVSLQPLGESS